MFVVIVLLLVEGGNGEREHVLSVEHDKGSYCSWVKIQLDTDVINDYRRGHEGSMDTKYISFAGGEMYYRDHLPTFGNH